MSDVLKFRPIVFLYEDEIRLASKALRAAVEAIENEETKVPGTPYSREAVELIQSALRASATALWNADDESKPLMLTNALSLRNIGEEDAR